MKIDSLMECWVCSSVFEERTQKFVERVPDDFSSLEWNGASFQVNMVLMLTSHVQETKKSLERPQVHPINLAGAGTT
jgi:tRNA U54 and U55 pseudouridine synthase Pus10